MACGPPRLEPRAAALRLQQAKAWWAHKARRCVDRFEFQDAVEWQRLSYHQHELAVELYDEYLWSLEV